MNYRHAYHAGNFADVFKHAALTLLITALHKKDKGICVIDTHAGIGRYDLSGIEAGKTLEFQSGIERVMAAEPTPHLALYREIVAGMNPEGGLQHYPGSPWIARTLARPQDRLELFELHPADAVTLTEVFEGDEAVQVRAKEGYQGGLDRLPPRERRGLVLVDPPFEKTDEFPTLVEWLAYAYRAWATGIFMLWYPVKSRGEVEQFLNALRDLGVPKTLMAEFSLGSGPERDGTFHGSGLIFINPPWQLDEALRELGAELKEALAQPSARCRVEWLVDEDGLVL